MCARVRACFHGGFKYGSTSCKTNSSSGEATAQIILNETRERAFLCVCVCLTAVMNKGTGRLRQRSCFSSSSPGHKSTQVFVVALPALCIAVHSAVCYALSHASARCLIVSKTACTRCFTTPYLCLFHTNMHDAAAVLSVLGAAGSLDEARQILHLKLLRLWPFLLCEWTERSLSGLFWVCGYFFQPRLLQNETVKRLKGSKKGRAMGYH